MPTIETTPSKQAGTPIGSFRDLLLQMNFDAPEDRKDPAYGLALLSRIYKEQNNQSSTYFYGGRNIRWMDVWQWFMGRQDMKQFLDFTNIDGTAAYTNVDFTQNRIGPYLGETLANSMASVIMYPSVTAVDEKSQKQKSDEKANALYRMRHTPKIDALQQQSGVMLEDPNAYVPDDELSAEIYFKLEHRLPKEIKFEELLQKVMDDNEFTELNRGLIRYLIALNCGCTKVEKLEDGFIYIRKCIPPNLVYNFFMSDSGKIELSYIGEIYGLKVRELRKKYGKSPTRPNGLSEKEMFEMCRSANQYNNSGRFYFYWNDSYLYATDRPYDDYSIQIFDCEVKVFDTDYAVGKIDSFGRENIQFKKSKPAPTSDRATVYETPKYTVYRGVWALKADKMCYWGLPDIVIKPFQDISESLFSYTIQIPNNDGDYTVSIYERVMEQLREYQLMKLKRKQLIAEMVPSGYSIDVEAARDVDLGGGNIVGWEEVMKIRNQSGVVVWSSRGLNPNDVNRTPPIIEMANAGSVAQLNEINNTLDRLDAEIRALLGVSKYVSGTDLPPRMGQSVVENQLSSSNNVSDFITKAAATLWQETLYKCCLIKWDEAVLKDNQDDLMDTKLSVKVEMKPTAYQEQIIEQDIAIGLKEGSLTHKDAFYIRNIKNYKLAQMYLSNMVDKNKKEAAQAQQANVEQTAQAQQASNQQTAQNQAQMEVAKRQFEGAMKTAEQKNEMDIAWINNIGQIIKQTGTIPDFLMPLAQLLIQNEQMQSREENEEMRQEIAQKYQQAMAAHLQSQMQQQQMQQGQMPPQPPPQGQPQPPQQPQQAA